jgi:hypothetical protein
MIDRNEIAAQDEISHDALDAVVGGNRFDVSAVSTTSASLSLLPPVIEPKMSKLTATALI